jgi:hypothetical protein
MEEVVVGGDEMLLGCSLDGACGGEERQLPLPTPATLPLLAPRAHR